MAGEYSQPSDLLKGDLPLPAAMGNGQSHVTRAAEEMDARLGQLYVTPIVIAVPPATNRPSQLYLKNVNNLIASGRLILELAISGEDEQLHAYGASLLTQGLALLEKLASGEIRLEGAALVDTNPNANPTAPIIVNEDSQSLVEAGYSYIDMENMFFALPPAPIRPYE